MSLVSADLAKDLACLELRTSQQEGSPLLKTRGRLADSILSLTKRTLTTSALRQDQDSQLIGLNHLTAWVSIAFNP